MISHSFACVCVCLCVDYNLWEKNARIFVIETKIVADNGIETEWGIWCNSLLRNLIEFIVCAITAAQPVEMNVAFVTKRKVSVKNVI